MTRKDYELVSRGISNLPEVFDTNWDGEETLRETVARFMAAVLSENQKFNAERFKTACRRRGRESCQELFSQG